MSFNFVIDPAGLYLKKIMLDREKIKILEKFNTVSFGITFKGNERILASWLIESRKNTECIFIGSSHIMTVSSFNSSFIKNNCKSFLNLGVSASSFEDFLIFTKIFKKTGNYPKKLFIEIPHWFLKKEMDTSYLIHKHYLEDKQGDSLTLDGQIFLNLLSLKYTQESFKLMTDKEKVGKNDFLYSEVYSNPWISIPQHAGKMIDGSHFYDTEYALKSTNNYYDFKPHYQFRLPAFEENVINTLSETLAELEKTSEIILVLTPYHQSSFQEKYNDFIELALEVEKFILKFGKEKRYRVLGSYDPNIVECKVDEFYDFMHPKNSCLEKVLEKERL